MSEAIAGSASASGQGAVIRANKPNGECVAAGGIIKGKGRIIRKNGEVVDFELVSDPLTENQAKALNEDS